MKERLEGFINELTPIIQKYQGGIITDDDCKIYQIDRNASLTLLGNEKFSFLDEVANICMNELNALMARYSQKGVPSIITKYRAALKIHFGDDCVPCCLFKAPKDLLRRNKTEYSKSMRNSEVESISSNILPKYMERATFLASSNSVAKRVIGLCALTGRRPIEIFATATFSPSSKGEKWAFFSGQAKTKGCEDARTQYDIPLLCDFDTLKGLFERFRRDYDTTNITPQKLHDNWSGSINRTCKEAFGEFLGTDVTPYDLRKFYCAAMEFKHNPQSVDNFYSDILGHEEKDVFTQRAYKKYTIDDRRVDTTTKPKLIPCLPRYIGRLA